MQIRTNLTENNTVVASATVNLTKVSQRFTKYRCLHNRHLNVGCPASYVM